MTYEAVMAKRGDKEWEDGDDSNLYDSGFDDGYKAGDVHGYSTGWDECETMWSEFAWDVIAFAIQQMDYDIEGGGSVNIEFMRRLVVFLRQFPTDWEKLSGILDNYIEHAVETESADDVRQLMRMRLEPSKEE